MKRILLSAFAVLYVCCVAFAGDTIRVACVGNSITYGHGIKDRAHDSYPAQLGALLGGNYDVRNFGVSARTLLNKGDHPYMNEQAYREALIFRPDVVVIKLGTNDSKPMNWKYNNEFKNDMRTLIRTFQALSSHPRIYLCLPIPGDHKGWTINDSTIVAGVIPYIQEVAQEMNLPVIDLHTLFTPYRNLLPDGVHPNVEGAGILAKEICRVIKADESLLVKGNKGVKARRNTKAAKRPKVRNNK